MESPPHRPLVLPLGRPDPALEEALSRRFLLLKPWEAEDGVDAASGVPSDAFLVRHADSVRVAVCVSFSRVDTRLLALLPRLECVVTPSMGVSHIDVAECRRRGVAVANAGTTFLADTAEYAVGLLIDVLRRVSAADRYVRSGRWPQHGDFSLGSKNKELELLHPQGCNGGRTLPCSVRIDRMAGLAPTLILIGQIGGHCAPPAAPLGGQQVPSWLADSCNA